MTVAPIVPPPGLAAGGRIAGWTARRPRYVVVDVDGTLVGADHVVREDVHEAVVRAASLGVLVGYATGRMHGALGQFDEDLRLPGPHVVHNGALVRHRDRTTASWPLGRAGVDDLLAIVAEHDAYAELYLHEGYLVTRDDPRAHVHWDLLGEPPRGGVDELGDREVLKATFIAFSQPERERLVAAVAAAGLEAGAAGSPVTPDLHYVNATRGGVDKGAALAAAATAAGTTMARTCAVGDGDNDLPMLAVAGTAVAMGQAAPHVHAAAHLVTTAVDDGGLAVALHALLDLPA